MGWGQLFDRITSWLPIQTADQRRRTYIEKLRREQDDLKTRPQTAVSTARLISIDAELQRLTQEAIDK